MITTAWVVGLLCVWAFSIWDARRKNDQWEREEAARRNSWEAKREQYHDVERQRRLAQNAERARAREERLRRDWAQEKANGTNWHTSFKNYASYRDALDAEREDHE